MRSKNAVSLIGHLGKKPELQKTPKTGTPFTRISLACNYTYRSGDDLVQGVDWIPIKVYGKLAEVAVKYLDKGSHVSIEARLKSWQQKNNGSTRYGMEVVANDILFLDAKDQVAAPEDQAPTPGHGEAPIIDDSDIPF